MREIIAPVHDAVIALGANVGDRRANLDHALDLMRGFGIEVKGRSDLYRSRALTLEPDDEGPWYLNAAIRVSTTLSPTELIEKLQRIEREAGRERRTRWEPRPLDLDILFYDFIELASPELKIPHPRWHERDFVLRPLLDLGVCLPGLNVQESRAHLGKLIEGVESFIESSGPWS